MVKKLPRSLLQFEQPYGVNCGTGDGWILYNSIVTSTAIKIVFLSIGIKKMLINLNLIYNQNQIIFAFLR